MVKKSSKSKSSSKSAPKPALQELPRSSTGIEYLDESLKGGFPIGSVILLSGNSGTGKTILTMRWLFTGADDKEPGIYVTMTEPISKLVRNASTLGFYDPTMIDNNTVTLTDMRTRAGFTQLEGKEEISILDIDELIDDLKSLVQEHKARRFVMDSVTAVCRFLEDPHLIRYFIFKLGTVLSYLNCTSILISEVAEEDSYSVFDVEQFIADGIVHLARKKIGIDVVRSLEVVKLRGTAFDPGPHHYKITEDGIHFYGKEDFDIEEMPNKRLKSGVPGVDDMLKGGFFQHTVTLLNGASGTGKSTFGMQFLLEGVKEGESVLLLDYEEAAAQLNRNVNASLGIDLAKLQRDGKFNLVCVLPESKSGRDHLHFIKELVEEHKPKRIVLDSLTALEKVFSEEDVLSLTKQISLFLKKNGVTSLFITAGENIMNEKEALGTRFSTIPDNIVLLRYVEIHATMRRFIAVLKQRGSDHEKSLREYTISDRGITVGKAFEGMQGVFSGNVQHTAHSQAMMKAFEELSDEKDR